MTGAQQQQSPGASRWRVAFAAAKDIGMTGLALWGVWHQEHTGKVNPWLLLTYVVVLGLIPAQHALALLRAPSGAEAPPTPPSAPDTAPSLR